MGTIASPVKHGGDLEVRHVGGREASLNVGASR
jgi:hypothetical protein